VSSNIRIFLTAIVCGVSLLPISTRDGHAQQPARQQEAVSRDTLPLSLEEVIARALSASEEVRLAKSQVDLANSQVTSARSQALPQISGNVSYTRTLASPFQSGGFTLPDSLKFEPDSTASMADRIRYLEKNVPNAALGGLGSLFGNLPFGQEHTYTGTISASQLLWSGGRVGTALKIASRYRQGAEFNYQEAVADVEFQVRNAYYRAALAQELEGIASAAVEQAQRFLDQERLRFEAGSASELDVLRAEVSLANLRPQLVESRNASELAMLDLKRLVNIPIAQPVRLVTTLTVPTDSVDNLRPVSEIAAELNRRAAVRAAEQQVAIKSQQVSLAKSAYLPTLSLDFRYGGQLFPLRPLSLSGTELRRDVAASLTMQVPIFSGFKRQADLQQARIELQQSELQLAQLREGVQLEYERARGERARALSSIAARQRTVEQAERVYDLTVLRYEKGLATQLETSDARLALLQARTNLVQALADFYIADAEVAKSLGRSSSVRRVNP
jgi:outer membrane protein